jgi:hypothetical protein
MAKATADIRSLARAQTELAIRTLTGICGSKAAPAAARVSAASALLDRGWGKPNQPHGGEDATTEFAELSANATAKALNERGLPSARGGKWTARSVINVRARLAD